MNKFNRIVAKTQKGLMEMEVEEGEEEQSMFQMVGRLASFFAKNINEGRDFELNLGLLIDNCGELQTVLWMNLRMKLRNE